MHDEPETVDKRWPGYNRLDRAVDFVKTTLAFCGAALAFLVVNYGNPSTCGAQWILLATSLLYGFSGLLGILFFGRAARHDGTTSHPMYQDRKLRRILTLHFYTLFIAFCLSAVIVFLEFSNHPWFGGVAPVRGCVRELINFFWEGALSI